MEAISPSSIKIILSKFLTVSITVADETTAELSMLCGFDDDLAAQATAVSNRLRGFLTQIHPHL